MITITNKKGNSRIYKSSLKLKKVTQHPNIPEKIITKLDFGVVDTFTDRGFGFITHTFYKYSSKNVFFHITTLKRVHPELVDKLNDSDSIKSVYFWYEFEESEDGQRVVNVLEAKNILKKYKDQLPKLIKVVEEIWKDMDFKISDWVNKISIDLIGEDSTNKLIRKRKEEEEVVKRKKKRKEEEKKKIEIKKLALAIEKEKYKRQSKIEDKGFQQLYAQIEIENKEFEQLVAEMIPLKFTVSSQVSQYIMKKELGRKYKNISGIVTMEQEGRQWDFKGGFPPDIYAQLCSKLNLGNKGSHARVTGFKPFKNLIS